MLDLGWSELLVIGIVALIVVGPKDLPIMFRRMGEFTGKARRMAREFQTAMNDAARESGVDDVASDLRKMSNPKRYGMDALKDATKDLTAWSPDEAAKGGTGTPKKAVGPHTQALSEERAAAKDKILKATAEAAERRTAKDAAGPVPDPAAPEPAPPEAKG